jgi:hypothetical protein
MLRGDHRRVGRAALIRSMSIYQIYEEQAKGRKLTVDGRDEWLAQQHREKRNCRILCASITGIVLLVVIAAAIVGWYFTKVRKI